ncbi:signal peptidase I [Streptomyces cinnamoneus]|uniref:Signal peptidase I n=1 Tax=Streptomyces cinnamoneus TaxID=53446 RepID=A0A2G1XER9_STRCJ|nr:signal peptidase I [Streptomyces cinnamoneus]PHQ49691.1 signal peptidase I [Streptomyces cinnamoneus]PPT16733.1 signal peptidase I [Streptomyces cinnamoneus]
MRNPNLRAVRRADRRAAGAELSRAVSDGRRAEEHAGHGSGADGRGRTGRVLSGLVVAVGCVLFFGGFAWAAVLYRPFTVPTDSMEPTIGRGERVLAQRIDGDEVRRGDVVVFRDKVWGDSPMLKRVVGVGGDKVACCDARGRLTIDGEPVEEPYLRSQGPASPTPFSATVPEGRLFLLGDHRADSLDSRTHMADGGQGAVERGAVEARVEAIAWPSSSWGMLERPGSFGALPGGTSQPGPLPLTVASVIAGAVCILGGAAYGPVAGLLARRGKAVRPDG